ncbi:MAG: hypothetical protein WCI57_00105 [Candidatus Berkelbacteria bacterium]
MNQVFYLEADEEITKVINRIRNCKEDGAVLVIPRGGTIGQSIINLKILRRNAFEHGKGIALVTNDSVTNNLSDQLGISVFSKVSEAEKANLAVAVEVEKAKPLSNDEEEKIKSYKKYDLSRLNENGEEADVKEVPAKKEILDQGEDIEEDEDLDEVGEGVMAEEAEDAPEIKHHSIDEMADEDESHDEAPKQKPEDKKEKDAPKAESKNEEKKSDDFNYVDRDRRGQKSEVNADDKIGRSREEKSDMPKKPMKRLTKVLIVTFSVLFVALLAGAYVFLPTAKASLVLKTSPIEKSFNVVVDKNQAESDLANMKLNGQIVTAEKELTGQYPSTGVKNVGEKAIGKVTVSNSYDTSKTIPIEKGAVIVRGDKQFVVQKGVFVPIATASLAVVDGVSVVSITPGKIDVDVAAIDPGEAFNLEPGVFSFVAFTGTKKEKVTAANAVAFAGGSTKEQKFVTADDLKKAETDMKKKVYDATNADLLLKIDESKLKVLEGCTSENVIASESSKKADDTVDTFDYKVKTNISALGFVEADFKQFVLDGAISQLASDQMIINPENMTIDYKLNVANLDQGNITLKADYKGQVGKRISTDIVRNAITNKSLGTAQNYLIGIDGVESVTLEVWPKFVPRTPILPEKIQVNFDYVQ